MAQDTNTKDNQLDFEKEMNEVEKAEKERQVFTKTKKENRVQYRRITIGAIFCLLAVIGLVSVLSGAFRTGRKIFNNDVEKEEYNKLLRPLVLYDPLPFETPDQANKELLRYSSLWAAVMNEDMSTYETDEYGQALLPAADVDKYLAKIFGSQIKLEHGTFTDPDEIEFKFDEEKQVYAIPTTSFPVGYTPKVEKIKTSFSNKTVTVGYLPPQKSWNDTSTGTVYKYVDYIFEKQEGKYCLVAIRESDMKVETTTNSSSTSQTTEQ